MSFFFSSEPDYFVTKIDAGAPPNTVELETPLSAPVPAVMDNVEMLFAVWSASNKNVFDGSMTTNDGVVEATNGEFRIGVGMPVREFRA
jgi:hypothetical protein